MRRIARPRGRRLPPELLGPSAAAQAARELLGHAAASRGHVLIVAERGLDPDGLARALHLAPAAFVMADCGTPDPGRLEEDLLGAPSGRRPPAAVERVSADSQAMAARGGTLYLANVTELPTSVQARLARAARDGEVCVRGGRRVPFDVRLVAAAPPSIDADVHEGRFRSDLFRRLSAHRIDVPPLRGRPQDVPEIVGHLCAEICRSARKPVTGLTDAALALLAGLPWRGNTRELRDLLERLLAAGDRVVQVENVVAHIRLDAGLMPVRPNGSLRDARRQFEREYIGAVLRGHGWRMSEAARALGIQRTNLYRKVRQLGIGRMKEGL